jgi:hypothetical protein
MAATHGVEMRRERHRAGRVGANDIKMCIKIKEMMERDAMKCHR